MNFLAGSSTVKQPVSGLLPQYDWLRFGVSERQHGNMRLHPNGAPIDPLARAHFALGLGVAPERIIAPQQVHGAAARMVTQRDWESVFEADGLITGEAECYLSITIADCLPIFFVDVRERVVGLAHAGWRGLLRGIIGSTMIMLKKSGARIEDLRVGLGPSIGPCHFEVGLAVARQFEEQLGADIIARREEKLFIDLWKSAARLLGRAGLAPGQIKTNEQCTYCDEHFFSYRRDAAISGVQSMMAVIGRIE